MYSYPPEFLLHPVPVMVCYGLSGDADEVPSSDSPSQRDGRSGLVDALSTILNSKNDYSFHEATRNPAQAPPFRIITVSKVK
jgi:hypothetical protein